MKYTMTTTILHTPRHTTPGNVGLDPNCAAVRGYTGRDPDTEFTEQGTHETDRQGPGSGINRIGAGGNANSP